MSFEARVVELKRRSRRLLGIAVLAGLVGVSSLGLAIASNVQSHVAALLLVLTRQEPPAARDVLWELGPEYGIEPSDDTVVADQLSIMMRVLHNENETPELNGWRLRSRLAEEDRKGPCTREIARGGITVAFGARSIRTRYVLDAEPHSLRARVGGLVDRIFK